MRKSVPKLSKEPPEGLSDLESLNPQTIHLPPDALPFLIFAPSSSLRGGYYKFCIIRLGAYGLRGAPLRRMASLMMRRRSDKCQWEVDFNHYSWRCCLLSGFSSLRVQVVSVCRRNSAALMGGRTRRKWEEGKSSVLSFSDLWWLKSTIRGVSQPGEKKTQNNNEPWNSHNNAKIVHEWINKNLISDTCL